jgi:hypothetical protein
MALMQELMVRESSIKPQINIFSGSLMLFEYFLFEFLRIYKNPLIILTPGSLELGVAFLDDAI